MNSKLNFALLSILFCWVSPVISAPLVKITCLGNNRYINVTDSSTDYLYANKTGVGSLGVYYKYDYPNNVFALQCPYSGTFVSTDTSSYHRLYVSTVTTPGDAEKFQLVWGGTNWGLKSVKYSKYVTANTTGNQLRANKSSIGSLYEQFSFTEVIDMFLAIKKWNDNYSSKYKLADTSLWPNYNTMKQMYIQDERDFLSGGFWIYEEFRDRQLGSVDPVWNYYGLRMIGDWEVLCCYKTIPLAFAGYNWSEGIPRCVRYLDFNSTNNTVSQTVNWYDIGAYCVQTYIGNGPEYGKQRSAIAVNLSNASSQEDMGTRWVVEIGYKDGFEWWGVDIGAYDANNPTIITVNPKYGIVYYYRYDGNPNNDTYSEFTNIQNKWGAFSNRCP